MKIARQARKFASFAAAVMVVAGGHALALAPAAQAAPTGTVMVKTQRMTGPTLESKQEGWYNAGDRLTLVCYKRGQAVQGHFSFNIPNGGWDDMWYKTSDGHFVADVDIETGTLDPIAPRCGEGGGQAPAPAPAPAPQGNPAQHITGEIACIANPSPVGVWVEAQSSKSGFAEWSVPVYLGGHTKVRYSYTLDHGGAYQVHVGCGGYPDDWGSNIKSDFVSGSHNFVCNDMNPAMDRGWKFIRQRIFGVFGLAVDNLNQNVPQGRCVVI